ncbi:hypothetical protein ES705_13508 [subsurface metagenome]
MARFFHKSRKVIGKAAFHKTTGKCNADNDKKQGQKIVKRGGVVFRFLAFGKIFTQIKVPETNIQDDGCYQTHRNEPEYTFETP